jgi:hypothetical protein
MKTSSKTFDKSKVYIKNSLSDQEMDEITDVVQNYKGPSLSLDEIFKIEKERQKLVSVKQ